MNIKSFDMEFTVKDNAEFTRNIDAYGKKVEDMMRDQNYAPVVDLEPQMLVRYEGGNFMITLTLFGMEVDDAWNSPAVSVNQKTTKYLAHFK